MKIMIVAMPNQPEVIAKLVINSIKKFIALEKLKRN
jgi:hypothetical protein